MGNARIIMAHKKNTHVPAVRKEMGSVQKIIKMKKRKTLKYKHLEGNLTGKENSRIQIGTKFAFD